MKLRKTMTVAVAALMSAGVILTGFSVDAIAATPQEVITKVAPLVVKYDEKGGILPSIKIAQILLESGNLSSELAVNANNPLGIKFAEPFSTTNPNDYYVLNSKEWNGSTYYNKVSKFRKYNSIEEAIKDHSELFTSSPWRANLYKDALSATNYKDQANALTGTYAHNPIYGTRLSEIIEKYNLTQYDGATSKPTTDSNNDKAPVVGNEEYILKSSTPVYITASNAENGKSSFNSYGPGTYFVYKKAGNAINISKAKGVPGAWISTKVGNVEATVPTTNNKPEVEKVENDGTITINNSVPVYVTSSSAIAKTGSVNKYVPGTYFIYKSVPGAINISKSKGKPGAWISNGNEGTSIEKPIVSVEKPVEKPMEKPVEKPVNNTSNEYVLLNSVKVYANASDALSGLNSIKTYEPGKYFIYKEYNGALNISKKNGTLGGWILPSGEKEISQPVVTPEVTVPKEEISEKTSEDISPGTITISETVSVYGSASDAVKGVGVLKTYGPGTYYIYKTHDGAINISKTANTPGAWIKY